MLLPPSCSSRPPSNPKPVELNVAPFCAIVVPEPLCAPFEKVDDEPGPVIVSVPLPLSSPPDCVRLATVALLLPMSNVPPDRMSEPWPVKFVTVKVPPAMLSVAVGLLLRALIVTVPELVTV